MKYSLVRLPWEKLEKGQGFFVPCLDTEAMREWGLKQAFFQRILDAHASVGSVLCFTGGFRSFDCVLKLG